MASAPLELHPGASRRFPFGFPVAGGLGYRSPPTCLYRVPGTSGFRFDVLRHMLDWSPLYVSGLPGLPPVHGPVLRCGRGLRGPPSGAESDPLPPASARLGGSCSDVLLLPERLLFVSIAWIRPLRLAKDCCIIWTTSSRRSARSALATA